MDNAPASSSGEVYVNMMNTIWGTRLDPADDEPTFPPQRSPHS